MAKRKIIKKLAKRRHGGQRSQKRRGVPENTSIRVLFGFIDKIGRFPEKTLREFMDGLKEKNRFVNKDRLKRAKQENGAT